MKKLGYADEYGRTVYRCPEPGCYYARQVPRNDYPPEHKCPEVNGQTRISWTVYGPSLLEKCWAELDRVTARLMDPALAADKVSDAGYARGLAFTLSLFMVPQFTTPQEIAREAKKRYEMRDTEYCTPGLAERRYEPPPGDHKLSKISAERAKITSKPKPAAPVFTPDQVVAINNAKVMFSNKQLAEMYKTTEDVIANL